MRRIALFAVLAAVLILAGAAQAQAEHRSSSNWVSFQKQSSGEYAAEDIGGTGVVFVQDREGSGILVWMLDLSTDWSYGLELTPQNGGGWLAGGMLKRGETAVYLQEQALRKQDGGARIGVWKERPFAFLVEGTPGKNAVYTFFDDGIACSYQIEVDLKRGAVKAAVIRP